MEWGLKKGLAFFWPNINSHQAGMLWTDLDCNVFSLLSPFEKIFQMDNFNFSPAFISPWKMAWCFVSTNLKSPLQMQLFRKRFWNVVIPLNKLESITRDALCHFFATVEIGSAVLEKNICKCWLFSLFCGEYFPLEKIMTLSSDKLESPSPNDVCAKIS